MCPPRPRQQDSLPIGRHQLQYYPQHAQRGRWYHRKRGGEIAMAVAGSSCFQPRLELPRRRPRHRPSAAAPETHWEWKRRRRYLAAAFFSGSLTSQERHSLRRQLAAADSQLAVEELQKQER